MFRQPAMHLMALFILIYVGVEVTLGGALLAVFTVRRAL